MTYDRAVEKLWVTSPTDHLSASSGQSRIIIPGIVSSPCYLTLLYDDDGHGQDSLASMAPLPLIQGCWNIGWEDMSLE